MNRNQDEEVDEKGAELETIEECLTRSPNTDVCGGS